jgi:hypothetical protein
MQRVMSATDETGDGNLKVNGLCSELSQAVLCTSRGLRAPSNLLCWPLVICRIQEVLLADLRTHN